MARDGLRLRLVDDAAPEQVAVVRRERVDLVALGVEREREVPAVGHPEVAVEAALRDRPPASRARSANSGHSRPRARGGRRASSRRTRSPAARRSPAGSPGSRAVPVRDRVPRVLPALVLEAGLLVAAPVPDVAVAHAGPRTRRSSASAARASCSSVAHELRGRRIQRSYSSSSTTYSGVGVGAAVVRRVRPLLERRHLAVAHLVEDPAGILVAEVVHAAALPVCRARAAWSRASSGANGQRLQAREDAVTAEHRHEPRQSGGRQAARPAIGGREAQRGEVDEAAPVGGLQSIVVAFQTGCFREPARGSSPYWAELGVRRVGTSAARSPAGTGRRHHVKVGGPRTVRSDLHGERQPLLIDLHRSRRGDRGSSLERLAFVTEQQCGPSRPARNTSPLLRARILTLEEVREIGTCLHAHRSASGLPVVVQDRELLGKPSPTARCLRITDSLGVDVHRAGARDQEEAGFRNTGDHRRRARSISARSPSAPTSTGTGRRTRTGRSDR